MKTRKKIIIFSEEDFTPSGSVDGHSFVDLDLPSGLKWATSNVGAESDEETGDLLSWGETEPQDDYELESYKYFEAENTYDEDDEDDDYDDDDDEDEETSFSTLKYNSDDELDTLEPKDDAATVNWGRSWRMPTSVEFDELEENCEVVFGEYNDVEGFKVTGPNGNSIFLPAAGYHDEESGLDFIGKAGVYWTSSLAEAGYLDNNYDFYYACSKIFLANENDEPGRRLRCRNIGESVRPVLKDN